MTPQPSSHESDSQEGDEDRLYAQVAATPVIYCRCNKPHLAFNGWRGCRTCGWHAFTLGGELVSSGIATAAEIKRWPGRVVAEGKNP